MKGKEEPSKIKIKSNQQQTPYRIWFAKYTGICHLDQWQVSHQLQPERHQSHGNLRLSENPYLIFERIQFSALIYATPKQVRV